MTAGTTMGNALRRTALVVGAALVAWGTTSTGIAQFTSGIQMVPLTVTVTNPMGRYVPGLTAAQFTVFEDGKPQNLSYFAALDSPVDVAFLLDTSSSMVRDLSLAQDAACGLTRRLKPGDRGAVAGVSEHIVEAQPMTSDLRLVEKAIRTISTSGATAIYEAVYILMRQFERQSRTASEPRRQAIILLSDGLDNASRIRFEDVLDAVRHAPVIIYVILLDRELQYALQGSESAYAVQASFAMRALARESGGRIFTAQSGGELPGIYEIISRELANQYLLGYSPARQDSDGSFRRIAVQVRHSEAAEARTRAGYYAVAQRISRRGGPS
jgi:Ca-activated chloride channel family protein